MMFSADSGILPSAKVRSSQENTEILFAPEMQNGPAGVDICSQEDLQPPAAFAEATS